MDKKYDIPEHKKQEKGPNPIFRMNKSWLREVAQAGHCDSEACFRGYKNTPIRCWHSSKAKTPQCKLLFLKALFLGIFSPRYFQAILGGWEWRLLCLDELYLPHYYMVPFKPTMTGLGALYKAWHDWLLWLPRVKTRGGKGLVIKSTLKLDSREVLGLPRLSLDTLNPCDSAQLLSFVAGRRDALSPCAHASGQPHLLGFRQFWGENTQSLDGTHAL